MTKQAYNENGVQLPEFTEAVSPVLNPLRDIIVELMDAGYAAADISYCLTGNIQLMLSSENIKRALEKRRAARNISSS